MSKSRSELLVPILALAVALVSACEEGTCVRESDCRGGNVCRVGRCVAAEDAGPTPDAPGFDTGDAPGLDVGLDAPADDAPSADATSSDDAPAGALADDAFADDAFADDALADDAFADDAFADDAFAGDAFADDAGM